METGLLSTTRKNKNNDHLNKENRSYQNTRLSIQLSLNGLSFCITDKVSQELIEVQRLRFSTPRSENELKGALSQFLESHNVPSRTYESVVVTHSNALFNIVPLALFDASKLNDYVKFNAQLLPHDELAYDIIAHKDMVVVYVPFTAANNYVFDCFGPFDFKHHVALHLEELLSIEHEASEKACYAHIDQGTLNLTVIKNKKLQFFNSFQIGSTEDLLYYILFSLEQLELDPKKVQMLFYGETTEAEPYYKKALQYLNNCSIYRPSFTQKIPTHLLDYHFDSIILNA